MDQPPPRRRPPVFYRYVLPIITLECFSQHCSRAAPLERRGSICDIIHCDCPSGKGPCGRKHPCFPHWLTLLQLLGDATEQLSMKLGQTLGGLLNAT